MFLGEIQENVLDEQVSALGIHEIQESHEEKVDYEKLERILNEHLEIHPDLFNSSKDRDIIVVLGWTGSGKSTLLNFLLKYNLTTDEYGNIVLENPDNPDAMQIGTDAKSKTCLPQFSVLDDGSVIYDLPGLFENRGMDYNLLNASFIKLIIENARSTKLVIVTGLDEAIAGRGEPLRLLLSGITKLLPIENLGLYSTYVVTRCDQPAPKLVPYLLTKVDRKLLQPWLEKGVVQMSKPRGGKIDPRERKTILEAIAQTHSIPIKKINLSGLFSYEISDTLKIVVQKKILDFSHRLIEVAEKQINAAQDRKSLEAIELVRETEFRRQFKDEIDSSKLVTLLKPFLGMKIYHKLLKSFEFEPHLLRLQAVVNAKIEQIRAAEAEAKQIEAETIANEEKRKREMEEKRTKDVEEARRVSDQLRLQLEEKIRQAEVERIKQELDPNNWPIIVEERDQRIETVWHPNPSDSNNREIDREWVLTVHQVRHIKRNPNRPQEIVVARDWYEVGRKEYFTGKLRNHINKINGREQCILQ